MKLSEFSVRKPITTIMIALSVIVLGLIALSRLPLESMPSVSWPSISISVNYPSSSPEEVERAITRPIEEIMGTLPKVKGISSSSSANGSRVRLEFDMTTDMNLASVHIRDRLDQVSNLLPSDVERIDIFRWSSEDWPILEYSLTWLGSDQQELATVYEQTILPRLQRIEGVGNVNANGLSTKSLQVNVAQSRLSSHHMDFRVINRVLRANNVNTSAGYVTDGDRKLAVRSIGEYEIVDQIRDQPLRPNITIGDVADVVYDYPERRWFERLDGHDAVTMQIQKSSTGNIVRTAELVREEMNSIIDEVGRDKLRAHLIRDRAEDVRNSIVSLAQSAIIGGTLAIIAIFIFLRNFRSTFIIGAAIPVSVLCVFLIMYFARMFGGATITLNQISMMGLMVAIGMLVDPAVVALENIFRKRYDEGMDARTAALEGSGEIGLPVLAASLTTICVFVPIVFVTDARSSLFMRDFALTVVIAVMASFCVALSLIPLAASKAFRDGVSKIDGILKIFVGLIAIGGIYMLATSTDWSTVDIIGALSAIWAIMAGYPAIPGALAVLGLLYFRYRKIGIKQLYARMIAATLHYRWATLSVACVILLTGHYVYSKVEQQPGSRYQPVRSVRITVEMPATYDVHTARQLYEQVEAMLIPQKDELDIEAISTSFSSRRSNRLTLYLTPPSEAKLSTEEVQRRVLAMLPDDIPGVRFKTGGGWGSSAVGVGIDITGRNPQVLAMLAEDIRLRLQGIPGVMQIETSLESGNEEIRVTVNRERAQRYGLSPQEVATTIAASLGARGSAKFKTPNGEIDIAVQLREEDRTTLDQLKNSEFETQSGGMVTFASLADFDLQKGRNTIQRQERMSTVTIFANTENEARFRVGQLMQNRMEEIPLPNGYSWQMDRSFRWLSQEQGQDYFTMIFAAILIYIIMASLFESYIHPFTIMFSIGFAFIGVALGLYITGIAMDSNGTYGLLILFGIVVNNGIVLVDHINRYRKQGLFRRDAIIRGGQDRLRPIMMTATTTIIGLMPIVVPMLYGNPEGLARRLGPIGLVVISGLSVSTVLTLILLPTMYSLMDDLSRFSKRVFVRLRAS